jgi:hypothetical protein
MRLYPREPSGQPVGAAPDPSRRSGERLGLVAELTGTRSLVLIRADLRAFGRLAGDDSASAALRRATAGEVDLSRPAHRGALLTWLRSWGCRHLRVVDTARSSRALVRWWERDGSVLPAVAQSLTVLRPLQLDAAAAAYAALAATPAAWRSTPAGRVSVAFGQTAAAKALFAIRPLALPPWDEPMRAALGLAGEAGYRDYLQLVAGALIGLSKRLGVPVAEVPAALGRAGSTPPQLVDEYLWMRSRR